MAFGFGQGFGTWGRHRAVAVVDPDAAAYFAACSGAGGGYDAAARSALSFYVAGLKSDGVWPLILDHGLFVGQAFAGILVKLKAYAGSGANLGNVNFVSGDYAASGSAAGLLGNGTSKSLTTGVVDSAFGAVGNIHLSVYNTVASSAGNRIAIGTYNSSFSCAFLRTTSAGDASDFSAGDLGGGNNGARTGCTVGSSQGALTKGYANGAEIHSRAAAGAMTGKVIRVMACEVSGAAVWHDGRLTAYTIGTGMTPAQVAKFANRINTLMAAFGAAKY